MFDELLPRRIANALNIFPHRHTLTEIRMRVGLPVYVGSLDGYELLSPTVVTREEINGVISSATGHSLYRHEEELRRGYLSYKGGMRIGVTGECVSEDNGVYALSHITSLCIRIPREIKTAAGKLKLDLSKPQSIVIIGGVGSGKTTLIRDVLRQLSDSGNNCLLIDERREISGMANGICSLDVGKRTDVLTGVDKNTAYEMVLRSMRPDIVFSDEIYSDVEIECLKSAVYQGIKFAVTIHGSDLSTLKRGRFGDLIELADYYVVLSDKAVGRVVEEGNTRA